MTLAWTGGTPGPSAPSGIQVTRMYGTKLKISWRPSTDPYHSKYKLYRSEDDFETESLMVTTSKTEYRDSGTVDGTYAYRVVDVDIHGIESDPSENVSITIGPLLPYTTTAEITTETIYDMYAELGRKATGGTIENKGPDTISIGLSYDGITYPSMFELEPYDIVNLHDSKDRIAIHAIKLTAADATITMVVT